MSIWIPTRIPSRAPWEIFSCGYNGDFGNNSLRNAGLVFGCRSAGGFLSAYVVDWAPPRLDPESSLFERAAIDSSAPARAGCLGKRID